MCERAMDLAVSTANGLRTHSASQGFGGGGPAAPQLDFSPDLALGRIHVFRAHDAPTQAAVCAHLQALCAARPRVKLVVLDSVAFHYRQGVEDYAARARTLSSTFASLLRLANTGIAVVITNQVTTKPGSGGGGGEGAGGASRLVPALGESFAHFATQRVLLYWQARTRCAMLFKSPRRAQGVALYTVTADGVRGVATRKRGRDGPQ